MTVDTPTVVTTGAPTIRPTTSSLAADGPTAVADEPWLRTPRDAEHDRLGRLAGVGRKSTREMSKVM